MDFHLFRALVDNANSVGEDFNDGDDFPGWLTARWVDGLLEITYENPEREKVTKLYTVTQV